MIQEDFYTGEPVETGSPPSLQEEARNEMEAANMASFGKYDYDPGTRQVFSPISIYPGGYGYNQYPSPVSPNFMNPPTGIGANPYSPYGNVQPTYNQYRGGNPVLQPGYVPYGYQGIPQYGYGYQQPQQQQRPTTYHIDGVGNNGEYMPPSNFEQMIDQIKMEYWSKQQDVEVKNQVDRQQSVYNSPFGGYGTNYYGGSYYSNPYQYNSINTELSKRIDEIKSEAREQRLQFDLNISRLAHNLSRDGISDEAIEKRYTGIDVPIPQSFVPRCEQIQFEARVDNMVPFDNSYIYRQFHESVSKEFHDIIPANSNLKDTFDNMGIVAANWEMEEERHRRKDGSTLYDTSNNSYKYYIRKKKQERYMSEKGLVQMPANLVNGAGGMGLNAQQARQDFVNSSPVLSQSANLAEDGTLNLSISLPCNVGSHKGETYTVANANEAVYDEKRARFNNFIDSIPGNIYLENAKALAKEKYSYE